MKLKANLHLHSNDDKEDIIHYSFIDALNEASRLGFSCLALTCHNTFIHKPEYAQEAETRGILFVPGIERTIEKKHVVILNPDSDIEHVQTFKELAEYKRLHPSIFIIAPHPYLGNKSWFSLHEKLDAYAEIFDAIEQTWFYSSLINSNRKAAKAAKKYVLPFIATSDTHNLAFINTSYAEIDVTERTIPALFDAIRKKQFKNISTPRNLFSEILPYTFVQFTYFLSEILKKRMGATQPRRTS